MVIRYNIPKALVLKRKESDMKRLDELIGIINGVNYDGVINEQEGEG